MKEILMDKTQTKLNEKGEEVVIRRNYLEAFKSEEELLEAFQVIEKIARKYYNSKPNIYKNLGLTVDDLIQQTHIHLLVKARTKEYGEYIENEDGKKELVSEFGPGKSNNGEGYSSSNLVNLKAMCTKSMNAILRGAMIERETGRKLEELDESGNVIIDEFGKKLLRKERVYISSLSSMLNSSDNESDNSENNFNDVIFNDNNYSERKSDVMIQLNMFSEKLLKINPECHKLFKVNSFINEGANLVTDKEAEELIELFHDEIYNGIEINKGKEIPKVNNRKININKIIKKLGLHITSKQYNEVFESVCELVR